MYNKLSLVDLDIANKKVLMRVDFNVPLDEKKNITDDTRIQASLPSIKYVIEDGGILILMSHLGRPKGKPMPEFSLAPCAKRLSQLLNREVKMAPDCIGPEVEKMVSQMKPGEILLLENLRFHKGEEKPEEEPEFVKQLAKLGDVYVNDAFGTAHRSHASTTLIAQYFPQHAVTGFLMQKEIDFLGAILTNPERPFYSIIGGAKISSKIGVLKSLIKKVDALFIGGGMAFTFFKAKGISIGDSIHEDDFLEMCKEIMNECQKQNVQLLLPDDVVIAESNNYSNKRTIAIKEGIPDGWQGLDIGSRTVAKFSDQLKDARTVFWNGPLGVFEKPDFAKGTEAIAETLSNLSHAKTIVGGGDSIAAINKLGLADRMTHLSTGGGASLEFIEYGTLPGIDALTDREPILTGSTIIRIVKKSSVK